MSIPWQLTKARRTLSSFQVWQSKCANHTLGPTQRVYRRGARRCVKCGKFIPFYRMTEIDAVVQLIYTPKIMRQLNEPSRMLRLFSRSQSL